MMCLTTDNAASYKIGAVIRFLHAKNISAAEIQSDSKLLSGCPWPIIFKSELLK
jgi:hypothetical protein